jgi:hypothetical protein
VFRRKGLQQLVAMGGERSLANFRYGRLPPNRRVRHGFSFNETAHAPRCSYECLLYPPRV